MAVATKTKKRMITKCIKCGNETYEQDSICILCKTNLTQIYEELIESLRKDRKNKIGRIKYPKKRRKIA